MKRLLVIENDAATLDIIGFIFENSEFEMIQSQKLLSLQEIGEINPDIIILDYLLDNGYGNKLCSQIKADPLTQHIPVILYSASGNIKEVAHDCHADAFIAKPFDISHIEKMVEELAL